MSATPSSAQAQKQVILHPILCAVYPAVFLYSANAKVFDFSILLAPVVTLVAAAALAWFLLARLMDDSKLAAVFTSMPLIAFFSYGAIEQAARSSGSGTWTLLVSGCVALVFAAALAMLKWRQYLDQATYIFNIVSLILAAAPLFQIGMWNVGALSARELLPDRAAFEANPISGRAPANAPDIYYFVLDGYGRDDVLRSDYAFDNTPFISDLEARGFYVARQAVSNYPVTLASISSTLNFTYLQDVVGEQLGDLTDRRFLRELMQDSRAVRLLKSAGYSIVSFSSEYSEAQIGSFDREMREWWFPNQFVIGMAQMTPIPAILGALGKPVLYDLHRYRTLYPLERMKDAVALDGPKFVYAHLYYGHPPFVFGPGGGKVSESWDYTWDDGSRLLDENDDQRRKYIESYAGQVGYLNGRLRETIDTILAGSKQTPIIVIHGDHGPGSRYSTESLENTDVRERYSIFYAALLPAGGAEELYPSISPINGMRVLFNRYFDAGYPLLEDASYFNPFMTPYHYTPVERHRADVSH